MQVGQHRIGACAAQLSLGVRASLDRDAAGTSLTRGLNVERRVPNQHHVQWRELGAVLPNSSLASHGDQIGATSVWVGAVATHLEVEVAVELEGRKLDGGVGLQINGKERLHHAI